MLDILHDMKSDLLGCKSLRQKDVVLNNVCDFMCMYHLFGIIMPSQSLLSMDISVSLNYTKSEIGLPVAHKLIADKICIVFIKGVGEGGLRDTNSHFR